MQGTSRDAFLVHVLSFNCTMYCSIRLLFLRGILPFPLFSAFCSEFNIGIVQCLLVCATSALVGGSQARRQPGFARTRRFDRWDSSRFFPLPPPSVRRNWHLVRPQTEQLQSDSRDPKRQ
ncbi:hypothetical protein V8C43DRAFT_266815 [Trichoderma afarasin]